VRRSTGKRNFLDPEKRLPYRMTTLEENHEMRRNECRLSLLLFGGIFMSLLHGMTHRRQFPALESSKPVPRAPDLHLGRAGITLAGAFIRGIERREPTRLSGSPLSPR
jgi:hypothetical protein